jgi:hypothetical protein
MRHWVSRSLAVLMLVPSLGTLVLVDSATAACHSETQLVTNPLTHVLEYQIVETCTEDVPPGDAPGGGQVIPGCDLVSPATFCSGPYACYYKESGADYFPPATPPPTPGADWRVRLCLTTGAQYAIWVPTPEWVGQAPAPPTLVERSRAAYGRLEAPVATLAFNPTKRTLVNLDTWFWAQGLTGQQIRGTPALGLVAVATPGHLQVTPGDGSAPFTCPWVTSKSDRCTHVYRRSSAGGSVRGLDGVPAYLATGVATWSVHFELDGRPVSIPGAPTELTGPRLTTAVEVDEVQTIVTWVR